MHGGPLRWFVLQRNGTLHRCNLRQLHPFTDRGRKPRNGGFLPDKLRTRAAGHASRVKNS